MKILTVGNFPFDRWSGGCVVANYLNREFKKVGHQVDSLSFNPSFVSKGEDFWGSEVKSFKTVSGKFLRVFRQFLDVYNPKSVRLLKKELRKINPDLVHIHNVHADLSAYTVKMVKKMGFPVVVTLHEFWVICPSFNLIDRDFNICNVNDHKRHRKIGGRWEISFFLRNKLIKKYLNYADYITAPSEFAASQLVQFGFGPAKVKVIHNGVDTEKFTPKEKEIIPNKLEILYVGRSSVKKGIFILLEAVKNIYQRNKQIKLKIVTKPRGIEKIVKKMPFVDILEDVNNQKLPEIYQGADIFVQPSRVPETFGLTVAEAMACGLPVIVSKIGGMPELVDQSGLLFEPNNAKGLKEKIETLIKDSRRREGLGKKARQRILENFSWPSVAQKYLDLFSLILKDE